MSASYTHVIATSGPRRRCDNRLNVYIGTMAPFGLGLLMHEGPDGMEREQRFHSGIRAMLERRPPRPESRDYTNWSEPLAEHPGGLQVLNLEARIVVLT